MVRDGNDDLNRDLIDLGVPLNGPDPLPPFHGTAGLNYVGKATQDRRFGEGGNDTLSGNSGDDRMWGGEGDDRLRGGLDRDDLQGDAGNDLLERHIAAITADLEDRILYDGLTDSPSYDADGTGPKAATVFARFLRCLTRPLQRRARPDPPLYESPITRHAATRL
jgi:hypothetical protein